MKTNLQRFNLPGHLTTAWDAFFQPRSEKQNLALRNVFLILLYLFGIYIWGKMFSWGRMPLDFFDWAAINVPRIDFIRDALQMGVLPLHFADGVSAPSLVKSSSKLEKYFSFCCNGSLLCR